MEQKTETFECGECGFECAVIWETDILGDYVDQMSFCPNCGSEFDGESDEEDEDVDDGYPGGVMGLTFDDDDE